MVPVGQIRRKRVSVGSIASAGLGFGAKPSAGEVTVERGSPRAGGISVRGGGGGETMGEAGAANRLGQEGEGLVVLGQAEVVAHGGEGEQLDDLAGGLASEGKAEQGKQADGNRIGLAGGYGGET